MNKIGKCIGLGGCSEVFEWGNEQVIKLFRSNTTLDAANIEFLNSIAAWESSLPVARPFEQVNIDGRPGIIFEKIIGETIKDRFSAQLYNHNNDMIDNENNDIRIISRVLYEIHKNSIPKILSNQKDCLKYSISWPTYLTDSEKQSICEYLDNLPTKNCLCHDV